MKKNVLISGGSGFVGRHLTDLLIKEGYTVSILSRSEKKPMGDISYYKWDVADNFIDEAAVLNADYIIHLAGENIVGKRWTKKRKALIIDSRVQSTHLIYSILKKNNRIVDAFISASAIGIYGAVNGEEICTEETPSANDFLGTVCQKWEASANEIESLGIRTVKIRTGMVLGKREGFLAQLVPIFKRGVGSALGSGKQYMPWIHIDDLCAIYFKAIESTNMQGAYNAAIDDNTTNAVFSKTLAKIMGYGLWLPNVPSFLIKMVMGEMAKLILTGRRVSAEKIEKTGFQFRFKNLETALKDCLG